MLKEKNGVWKEKTHHVYKPYLLREIIFFARFYLLDNECVGRILRLVESVRTLTQQAKIWV
jgi:hypothetical protein